MLMSIKDGLSCFETIVLSQIGSNAPAPTRLMQKSSCKGNKTPFYVPTIVKKEGGRNTFPFGMR